jgi:MOSC domain-containing protein YiiM
MTAFVASVSAKATHSLWKSPCDAITLVKGMGVAGDAHCGVTVKHRSRVARDPSQPNLRQVHLIHAELLDWLAERGFAVSPADLGENITTRGVDLLALPTGTVLRFGEAVVRVTGLRNPCAQLNGHAPGLMDALLERGADGALIRKGGVMAVVTTGGTIRAGDAIGVDLPAEPHLPLQPV